MIYLNLMPYADVAATEAWNIEVPDLSLGRLEEIDKTFERKVLRMEKV